MEKENTDNGTGQVMPFRKGHFTPGDDPRLIGSKCKLCNTVFYPPRSICTRCFEGGVMERIELSRRGELCSYTTVWQNIPRYRSPYMVAYVDLPEGVRVFAHLTDCDPSALRIGMKVETVVDVLRKGGDGKDVVGYKFRPIHGDRGEGKGLEGKRLLG